ncbi:hypothetical protein ZIOFF_009149 [Zingiber officinale]|uniref:Uncharacterized protein n=1 Tax=Zingiber officinale TaxID=94328 RepID=A0A8J5LR93_ZINOF|nr:hypothetical protein ZIOFF_009149 [Zingiber officinale]
MQCCMRDGVAGRLFSPKSVVQDLGHVLGMPTNIGHGANATNLWSRASTKHKDLGEGLFHDPSGFSRCGSSVLCGLKDGYGFRSVSCGCSTYLVRSVLAAEEALQARKQFYGSNCKGVDASWGSEQDGWARFLMIDWEGACKISGKDLEVISPCILVESILGLDLLVPEAYNFNSNSSDAYKSLSVALNFKVIHCPVTGSRGWWFKSVKIRVRGVTLDAWSNLAIELELLGVRLGTRPGMNQVLDLAAMQKISTVEITPVTIGIRTLKIVGRNHEIRERIAALEGLVSVVPEGEDVCNLIAKIFKPEANMEQIQESLMEELV